MSIEVGMSTMGAFSAFAPSVMEARRADPADPGLRRDLRIGEGMALLVSLAIAGYYATKGNTPKPYLWWAGVALFMFGTYEFLLRSGTESDSGCGCGGEA